MNKMILQQLGDLTDVVQQLHNIWVDSNYDNKEVIKKINLLNKVKKQLENQKRGTLKSKVNYSRMAHYLIVRSTKTNYPLLLSNTIELM
jgi:septal ring factor EnvC (AmiA/AmiB activator)